MAIIYDFRTSSPVQQHCEHGVPLPRANCSACTPCEDCENWGYSAYRIGCPKHFPDEHQALQSQILKALKCLITY